MSRVTLTQTAQPGSVDAMVAAGCDRSLGLVQLLVLVASVQPAGCTAYQHLIVGLLLTYSPIFDTLALHFLVGHASGTVSE